MACLHQQSLDGVESSVTFALVLASSLTALCLSSDVLTRVWRWFCLTWLREQETRPPLPHWACRSVQRDVVAQQHTDVLSIFSLCFHKRVMSRWLAVGNDRSNTYTRTRQLLGPLPVPVGRTWSSNSNLMFQFVCFIFLICSGHWF